MASLSPRLARIEGTTRNEFGYLLALTLVFPLVGGLLAVRGVRSTRQARRAFRLGTPVKARVIHTGIDSSSSSNGRNPYCVRWEFSVQARRFTGEVNAMDARAIADLAAAKELVVLYDPADPRANTVWVDGEVIELGAEVPAAAPARKVEVTVEGGGALVLVPWLLREALRLGGPLAGRGLWALRCRFIDNSEVRVALRGLLAEGERLKRRAVSEAEPPLQDAADWVRRATELVQQRLGKDQQRLFQYRHPGTYLKLTSGDGQPLSTANEAFWNSINAYTARLKALIGELRG